MSWDGVVDAVLAVQVTSTAASVIFIVGSAAGIAVLAIRRHRRWLLIGLASTACAALLLLGATGIVVEKIWRPFPDPLPASVYLWLGVAMFGAALGVGRWIVRRRDRCRVGAGAAVLTSIVVVMLCAAGAINAVYDRYPTVRSVLGLETYRTVAFDTLPAPLPAGQAPSIDQWTPPVDLPATGAVTSVTIPGVVSGFSARQARIYLPPAYFAEPRPDLPVLVLLAGQPGSPDDWLVGGRLAEIMNAYTAKHRGLAPLVVVADGTGGEFDNPLCVDSPRGNAATYLGVDVPQWVRTHLQADPDPRAWAVGGLSYGGTCALQLATTRPEVYPTFLDLSGQAEPTLADKPTTIREVFGGDTEAFARNNPADLLARNRYPDSAGAFVVGAQDNDYRAGIEHLAAAAQAAGMDVHLTELPGSHSFEVWSAGLEQELPWLSHRLGLDSP
ncbi:alpha/beta hydrolase [Rhodococcus rhodochrous]|uniref:alpha/beta hydrolase n=1 Tax=Rhodococcus rhodochrous TaxID=1829 RepID=UPI0003620FEB|nr:alpha/beta hydrolase-fold protein [Rhodococcus rhodochrous]